MTLVLLSFIACGSSDEAPEPVAEPVEAPAPPVEPEPEPKPAAAAAPGNAEAGETVYVTYCQACHQADGTGMGGMLAADFIKDKTRLEKSDDELLTSIRDGLMGNGAAMPPWGTTLDEQQMARSWWSAAP